MENIFVIWVMIKINRNVNKTFDVAGDWSVDE